MTDFIPKRGNYRKLRCFLVSEHIYDLTFEFCNRHLQKGDRTIDQMVQAARSGKQNIAEGSAAATTSKETEIKLTNVAKASLQELLLDYEDFLITRRLHKWVLGDPRLTQTREVLRENHDRQYYLQKSLGWTAETMANVVITMIHQCDYLLGRLIESQKERFLKEGGIREEMSRARREYRQSYQGQQSNQSAQSYQSYQRNQSYQNYQSNQSNQSAQSAQSAQSDLST